MKRIAGMRARAATLCSLAALFGTVASAQANTILDVPVHATGNFAGPCFDGAASGGAAHFKIESPYFGYLRLALSGGSGDWDVAVYSRQDVVTGASTAGPDEVATGYMLEGESLDVQVCRNPGAGGTPTLQADVERLRAPDTSPPEILRVETTTAADRAALERTGLDTEAGTTPVSTDVVAYGASDRRRLEEAGLGYAPAPGGLGVVSRNELRADDDGAQGSGAAADASLPSGRTDYRRIFDYEQEMKGLATAHPGLVRLFELPNQTFEGRPVLGLELGDNPGAEEGEPVFLHMGLHHGREWPSGEITLEWAYELLDTAAAGDARALAILRDTKTLIVPVVNPDGFNISREAGQLRADFGIRDGNPNVSIPVQSAEFQRKNCRLPGAGRIGDCGLATNSNRGPLGVDINRNYGGMWGGSGGGLRVSEEVYRGPGPFSEPETRNVRELFSTNQVIAASSNHTYSALILRPPLVTRPRLPFDEALMRRVGARMARATGYANTPGTSLYDSSGGMEGWSYFDTGSIDFTPELGTPGFHPAFTRVIGEWAGTTRRAKGRGGMRKAIYSLEQFTRRDSGHVVLSGTGPPGAQLLFRKTFKSRTLPVLHLHAKPSRPRKLPEHLATSVEIGADGTYEAHLNPSTRPIVAERKHGIRKESWRVICVSPSGEKLGARPLYAKRGERLQLDVTADGC